MLDIRYPLDTDMLQLGAATAAIICSNTATVPSHGKQYTSLQTFVTSHHTQKYELLLILLEHYL